MRSFRSLHALALTLVLMLLLAGCGGSAASAPASAPAAQQPAPSAAEAPAVRETAPAAEAPSLPPPAPAVEKADAEDPLAPLYGVWRMSGGETEGWTYAAEEVSAFATLSFAREGYAAYSYRDGAGNEEYASFRSVEQVPERLWDAASDWRVRLIDDIDGTEYAAALDGDRLLFGAVEDYGTLFFEKQPAEELLTIDYCATRGEAEARGASALYDVPALPDDEPGTRYWALLTAAKDGTHVRVERMSSGGGMLGLYEVEGLFVPGALVADTVLDAGASVAVETNQPWVAEIRVSAWRDGFFGSYCFGSDNYYHLDDGARRYVAGAKTAVPASAYELLALLDGEWTFLDGGEHTACFRFFCDGSLSVSTEEDFFSFRFTPDRLYAPADSAPDLLCLHDCDEDTAARLSPMLSTDGSCGDYLVEFAQCDGEQLLLLTQANNGDAVLPYLIPHGGSDYSFLLHRYTGAAADVPRRQPSGSFPAFVWKYDADEGLVWIAEAAAVDEAEDGSAYYRVAPGAVCAAYRPSAQAVAVLSALPDPAYPAALFEAAVRSDGTLSLGE